MTVILIRSASVADAEILGEIHYSAWMETYTGLMDERYLQTRSKKASVEMFKKNGTGNFLVAELDGEVLGFAGYGTSRDEDLEDSGEIFALYVLKKGQNKGVGKRLLEFAIRLMGDKSQISLWVLDSNQNAIQFYQHCGFIHDGKTKVQRHEDTLLKEIRMIKKTDSSMKRGRRTAKTIS